MQGSFEIPASERFLPISRQNGIDHKTQKRYGVDATGEACLATAKMASEHKLLPSAILSAVLRCILLHGTYMYRPTLKSEHKSGSENFDIDIKRSGIVF